MRGKNSAVCREQEGDHHPAPVEGVVLLLATSFAMNAGDLLFGVGVA